LKWDYRKRYKEAEYGHDSHDDHETFSD